MPIRKLVASKAATVTALMAGLAGCAGGGAPGSNSFAQTGGSTIAFESIDGPPPQVFERMVNVLDSESRLRNIAVVSREAPAAYRVRSYLAAQVSRGRTTIAWVWDIYDREQQRALRLSGDEPGGKSTRDAWAAADDLVLRRIAQAGLTGLHSMMNGGVPAGSQPVPRSPAGAGPAVARSDDATPNRTADAALGFSPL